MATGTIDGKYYDNIPTPEDWGRAQAELADLQAKLQQAQEVREQALAFIRATGSHKSQCGIRVRSNSKCDCDLGAVLDALGGE